MPGGKTAQTLPCARWWEDYSSSKVPSGKVGIAQLSSTHSYRTGIDKQLAFATETALGERPKARTATTS